MAKVKYSALVSDMRNKLNGSVLSKNRYGNYIRNKVTPVNPQTQFQQAQRAALTYVSQAWSGLSDTARKGFAALAESHPFTDIFGDQKSLDGKAMFSKLSLNLISAMQAPLTVAPVFEPTPSLGIGSVDASVANGIELNASQQTVPVGYSMVVQATPPLSPTINFVKNRYRSLGPYNLTAGVGDIASGYDDRFGALTSGDIGKVVHVRAFLVNNATGQASIASAASAVIVA